jgi:hypothetical protein
MAAPDCSEWPAAAPKTIKVKVKVKFQRWSRGIALLFL